jgi:uncharacterized protein YigE (DUF2233 family)
MRILWLILIAALCLLGWIHYTKPQTIKTHAKSACTERRFERSAFIICAVDPVRHDLALVLNGSDGKPLRSLPALATHLSNTSDAVTFAMNAGMYDLTGNPIGLYVENGIELHPLNRRMGAGNFHIVPNGVFWKDKTGQHVATTDDFAAMTSISPTYATQSGPMLVINGIINQHFSPDGESRNIRNGVGIDVAGKSWFVISKEPVSFGKFARLFQDELQCPNALYLDGLVSSLWDGSTGRADRKFPLGPLLVVTEKALKTP